MWKKFSSWLLKHFEKRDTERKCWERLKKMMQKSNDIQIYFLTFKSAVQALESNITSAMMCYMFLNELKSKLMTEWYQTWNQSEDVKSIVMLLIQIELRLQLTKDVSKAEYDNSTASSRLIMTTEEDNAMNLSAITQSQNSLKKNLSEWLTWCKHHKACFVCENKNHAKSKCSQNKEKNKEWKLTTENSKNK